jgi:hypothetical protein
MYMIDLKKTPFKRKFFKSIFIFNKYEEQENEARI